MKHNPFLARQRHTRNCFTNRPCGLCQPVCPHSLRRMLPHRSALQVDHEINVMDCIAPHATHKRATSTQCLPHSIFVTQQWLTLHGHPSCTAQCTLYTHWPCSFGPRFITFNVMNCLGRAHPVVTTAPVPWMSSLKHRRRSRILSRIANARLVSKSARTRCSEITSSRSRETRLHTHESEAM